MCRLLLAILLTFATCAVVVHGIMVYQLSDTASIIAEEETSENKSLVKESKEVSKETVSFSYSIHQLTLVKTLYKSLRDKNISCSKGFYDKPYNPPEAS